MLVDTKYGLGDLLYLKTDKEQLPRLVSQILICTGGIKYALACGVAETWHYELEVTTEVNILMKID